MPNIIANTIYRLVSMKTLIIKINSAASPAAAALVTPCRPLGDEFRPAHDLPLGMPCAVMRDITLIIRQTDHQVPGFANPPPQHAE
jgi:hypothetical protein